MDNKLLLVFATTGLFILGIIASKTAFAVCDVRPVECIIDHCNDERCTVDFGVEGPEKGDGTRVCIPCDTRVACVGDSVCDPWGCVRACKPPTDDRDPVE